MRKFIALSLLALLTAATALACGGWGRPHYYMFHVCPEPQEQPSSISASVNKYWIDYTGGKADSYDVNALGNVDLKKWSTSDNEIVKAIIAKNDYEAELYVKRLIGYLNISDALAPDAWNYPTAEEKADYFNRLAGIRAQAMGYKGERFKAQYALLVMRTYMAQGLYTDNIDYWNKTASRLPASVYRDMMRGIYANALTNSGRADEARVIYAELGDYQSLRWMLRKKRNLAGIKEEYNRDPNSLMLPYLVEDFVNNAQETLDCDGNKESIEYTGHRAVYNAEVKQFITFAKQVAAKKGSRDAAMWLSAAGLLEHISNRNNKEAIALLEKATTLSGTQEMKDNARRCLILAKACDMHTLNESGAAWLAGELKWLEGSMYTEGYTMSATSRIADDAIVPLLANDRPRLMAFYSWMASHDIADWSGDYYATLDSVSSTDFDRFFSYINDNGGNELDRMLRTGIAKDPITADRFNDMMGTKLVREGNFAAAIPYLEKVPLAYLNEQGIARYASRRDFHVERWLKRQIVDYDDGRNDGASPAIKVNQKIQFCKEVLQLQSELKAASGNKACDIAYRLATILFQASYYGDCWYLAESSWSFYNDPVSPGHYDFAQHAAKLLDRAVKTSDANLRVKAMYARAYMPFDPCMDYETNYTTWEGEWKRTRTDGYNFLALSELAKYRRTAGSKAPRYVTRCDILTAFMKY